MQNLFCFRHSDSGDKPGYKIYLKRKDGASVMTATLKLFVKEPLGER